MCLPFDLVADRAHFAQLNGQPLKIELIQSVFEKRLRERFSRVRVHECWHKEETGSYCVGLRLPNGGEQTFAVGLDSMDHSALHEMILRVADTAWRIYG